MPPATLRDAQLMAEQLEFSERRWRNAVKHPLAVWGAINRVGYLANVAKQAGDLATYRRLDAHVQKLRATGKTRWLLLGHQERSD